MSLLSEFLDITRDWRSAFPHLTIKREAGLVGAGAARAAR